MIYITGDTHGEFGRFPGGDVLPGQRRLLRGDYVIVCGDLGLCWAKDTEFEYHCDFFMNKPFTLLWYKSFEVQPKYLQKNSFACSKSCTQTATCSILIIGTSQKI